MINLGEAVGYLDLDTTGFKRGFQSAFQDLKIFKDESAKATDKFKALGGSMTKVGSSLTKNVTVPLAGAGALAIKFASDFEKGLSGVKAVTSATAEEMEAMKQSALLLGAETAFSAGQAAEGMAELGQAGFSVSEILDAMPGLLDVAASSGTDLAIASEITASALRGFGLEAKESGHVADVLAKSAADTNANITDMGEAMKYIAPVASSMGISIEETAAAIGLLSNAGIKGSQAGTTLRASLTRLAKPSEKAAGVMQDIGFSAYTSEGKMKSLDGIITGLGKSLEGMTDETRQNAIATIFGTEALSGMLVLLNSEENALKDLTKALETSDGAAKNMAETMLDNTAGSIEQLMGSLETLAISLGDILIPAFRGMVDWLTKIVNAFTNLDQGTKETIVTILKVVAAVGPILLIFGKLFSGIGSILSLIATFSTALGALGLTIGAIAWPILAVVGALAALWIAWQNDFGGIQQYTKDIFGSIKELIDIFWGWLTGIWESNLMGIQDWWNFIWGTIQTVFEHVFDAIKTFFDFWVKIFQGDFQGAWDLLVEFWGRMWERIKTIFSEWWEVFSATFMKVWNKIVNFFKGVWDGISEFAVGVWTAIVDFFVNIWTGVGDFFVNLWTNISDFFVGIWNDIMSFFTETIPNWINDFIGWFKNLPYNIGVFFGQMLSHIINFGNDVLNWILVDLPLFIQGIIDWFAKLPGEIWNWLVEVVMNITNWGIEMGIQAGLYISDMFNKIIDWFAKLPEEIWKWLTEVISNIIKWGAEMIFNATEQVSSMWNAIVDWFARLPGEIWKWLSDIINKVISWGFEIKIKAEKAIKDMWNAIIDWFKRLPGEIQRWFNDVLTFLGSLPSKMFEIGKNIINGLWDGLKNVWDNVVNWFEGVFSAIGDFFTGVNDGMEQTIDRTKGSISSTVNGSYRSGLDYVPYDGFRAVLHEGEKVLTKQEARGQKDTNGDTYIFQSPKALTPVESARQMKKAKREIELGFN